MSIFPFIRRLESKKMPTFPGLRVLDHSLQMRYVYDITAYTLQEILFFSV